MNNKDKWSQLSIKQRADLIKLYVESGIKSLDEIRKDYNGVPYRDFHSSNYDYFGAHPSNAPTEEGGHWTSRNPKTGQLLKREDHPTFDLMIEGENQANYKVVRGLDGNLYSTLKEPDNYLEENSFGDGGFTGTPQYYDNTYIEPAISKAFNSEEAYNRYKGEQFGKSITSKRDKLANKIGTLIYDVAQLHPVIGTGLDVADIIMNRGNEEILPSLMSTDGKITSLVDKLGKSGKVGMGTVFGKILQLPDTAFDVIKLVEDFKKPLNQYGDGGPTEEGGYSDKSKWYREVRHSKLDPAGGLGLDQLFYLSNHSKGDEDQYWRAYLGLENHLPKMNPTSKTEWDDKIEAEKIANGELPSDFYGTTNNMDLYIQAMADTTTTGKIVRNYDEFKKLNPHLSPKKEIEAMYRSGKAMMDNPNKWTQVGEVKGSAQLDIERKLNNGEEYPLGMLASFGAKWIPEENTVHIHDTYDFPWYSRILGRIPERPKEMKIRGKVKYNPKKQAKLFNADNFNLIFPK